MLQPGAEVPAKGITDAPAAPSVTSRREQLTATKRLDSSSAYEKRLEYPYFHTLLVTLDQAGLRPEVKNTCVQQGLMWGLQGGTVREAPHSDWTDVLPSWFMLWGFGVGLLSDRVLLLCKCCKLLA